MASDLELPRDIRFEAEVTRRARSFELKALLRELTAHGYSRDTVLFRGAHDGSSGSFVVSVEFTGRPRSVLVTVDLGLLGPESMLPSYFLREAERSANPDAFYDFVAFFEHVLIDNFVAALWPEDDAAVYPDYTLLWRAFLGMGGVASVASLAWLVQLMIPELPATVTRASFPTDIPTEACRSGTALLDGTSVLGDTYTLDADGFRIDLTAEEEVDSRGRIWAKVLGKRIRQRVLPLLAPHRLALCIRLHVQFHTSWLKLEAGGTRERTAARAPGEERPRAGYLGYDRIRIDGTDSQRHTVLLWQGTAGENSTL